MWAAKPHSQPGSYVAPSRSHRDAAHTHLLSFGVLTMLISTSSSARILRLEDAVVGQSPAAQPRNHSRRDLLLSGSGRRTQAVPTLAALPTGGGEPAPVPSTPPQTTPVSAKPSPTQVPTTTAPQPQTTPAKADTQAVPATTVTSASDREALERLRQASLSLRGVDIADFNMDWAQKMVDSGVASDPAFYKMLEDATAVIKEAYQRHYGREPTKGEMAAWLPFAPSMEANKRQWQSNLERLQDRQNLDYVAARETARTGVPSPEAQKVQDAQITEFIRANISNPDAIANAMVEYGVSMGRLQSATGATWDEIVAYVAQSGNGTLQRLLAEHLASK